MGRSVDPTTSQVTQASNSSSTGVPTRSARVTVCTVSVTGSKETPAITMSPLRVRTVTTRIVYGMSYGRPLSRTARPARGVGVCLAPRQQRNQPVSARRGV